MSIHVYESSTRLGRGSKEDGAWGTGEAGMVEGMMMIPEGVKLFSSLRFLEYCPSVLEGVSKIAQAVCEQNLLAPILRHGLWVLSL